MNKDSLGDRMKKYEYTSRYYLTRRIPVIIRLDGKAFHTFAKGFKKPFDDILGNTMQKTMQYLCENIQGCVLGYTQSDEITLVLTDYKRIESDAWFSYNIQKMVSIAASLATSAFNRYLLEEIAASDAPNRDALSQKIFGALFDARAFTVPIHEVNNCLIWRQQDAIRNSVSSVGYANFSAKEMFKKRRDEVKAMLLDKGIEWDKDVPLRYQRGSCCIKKNVTFTTSGEDGQEPTVFERGKWVIDNEIPIFSEDTKYVSSLL